MDNIFTSQTPTSPPVSNERFAKLKNFFRRYRKPILIASPIILLAVIGGLIWYLTMPAPTPPETVTTPVAEEPKPTTAPSLLNGVIVSNDVANRRVVAAMIENSTPARPQAGLTSADVVYEAVTEGGITRFMGLYQQTYPDKAGPVRSARSYYIDWLSEFDAIYAHVGGSPTALAHISSYGIKDAGPFSSAYHREPKAGVATEHTDFVNLAQVYSIGTTTKGWSTTNDFSPWKFKDPSATPTATGPVTIKFSSSDYDVKWDFDTTANQYSRTLAGTAHKDRVTGEQIKAGAIVVMTVQNSSNGVYQSIAGHEAEWTMNTISSGNVTVFEDGTKIDGQWKKPTRTDRTRFYDSAGQEISINRGKIWVEVVPQTGSFSVAAAPSA